MDGACACQSILFRKVKKNKAKKSSIQQLTGIKSSINHERVRDHDGPRSCKFTTETDSLSTPSIIFRLLLRNRSCRASCTISLHDSAALLLGSAPRSTHLFLFHPRKDPFDANPAPEFLYTYVPCKASVLNRSCCTHS